MIERHRLTITAFVLTFAALGQIILSFVLYNEEGNIFIRNLGWILLWISAIFGWLPMFTLRKWGKVPDGKAYVHTTELVDRGIFGIVRHPQYLAGILLGIGLSLIVQHWLVAILGVVVAGISYSDTHSEEKTLIGKFGAKYEEYMKRVPRVNFLLGMLRLFDRKNKHK